MRAVKRTKSNSSKKGFTVWELLGLSFVVTMVMLILLPALCPRRKPYGIECVNNLKQIGLALRMWSNDHAERFPIAVSTNEGGSLEWIGLREPFRHFLIISNELNSPKVLTCSSDPLRRRVSRFENLTNKSLSYFIGLDASETQPQSILSGDRNISTNDSLMSGILTLARNSPVRWTKHNHNGSGNMGLGDGSAQQANTTNLQTQIGRSPYFPVRLEIP